MDWMTDQKGLDAQRREFLKSESGSILYSMEMNYLQHHVGNLKAASKLVKDMIRRKKVDINALFLLMIDETPVSLECIVIILREDGCVYFGRSPTTAALGMCGRFKDGRVEFYDYYNKDLIGL